VHLPFVAALSYQFLLHRIRLGRQSHTSLLIHSLLFSRFFVVVTDFGGHGVVATLSVLEGH